MNHLMFRTRYGACFFSPILFCNSLVWGTRAIPSPASANSPNSHARTQARKHPRNHRGGSVSLCVCMYVCMSMLVGICACVRLNQCQRQGRTLILCVLAHIHSYTRIHTLTHSHTPFHSILSAQKPPPNSKNYRKPSPPLSFREKDAFKTGVRNCDTVVGSQSAGRTAR